MRIVTPSLFTLFLVACAAGCGAADSGSTDQDMLVFRPQIRNLAAGVVNTTTGGLSDVRVTFGIVPTSGAPVVSLLDGAGHVVQTRQQPSLLRHDLTFGGVRPGEYTVSVVLGTV